LTAVNRPRLQVEYSSTLTHFNGITTTYVYDGLNRLLSRTTPGEATVSFTYTPTGKYLTSTAADGTVNYTYDALDRLITKQTPEGTLGYTYDAAGHVASINSSNSRGVSVAYTYDDVNRLSTVVDNGLQGNNTTTYAYDAANNVATATLPNGVQSLYSYDALNRVSTVASQNAGYAYVLGPTGNRTGATELNGRTLSWSYDGINRLTNETISGDPASDNNGSATYGLDPVGNRLSSNSSLSAVSSGSFGYNADDQISSENYDANGNTIRDANGNAFTFDSENHMTTMRSGSTLVTMKYDAFGNRVSKTVNGVTTQYLVEDDVNPTGLPQVIEEVQNGAAVRSYTYGLQRISQNQVVNNTWTPSFYGYDGFGSVRQLTNATGAVTDSYEYDAFGNSFTKSGTTPNNYLYRGEQFDSDLGLYYLRARYYNPANGRFLSRDPFDGYTAIPVTLHKYLYAGINPTNREDPSGRDLFEFAFQTAGDDAAVPFLNSLGCLSSIGFAAAGTELNAWTLGGVGSAAYGCVSSYIWPGGKAFLTLKAGLDVGACLFGLAQVVNDINQQIDYTNVSQGTLYTDISGGVIGCAITGISKAIEGGH
jgi:RHS repeat-associated protein